MAKTMGYHSYHVDLMPLQFEDIISLEDQYEVAKARASINHLRINVVAVLNAMPEFLEALRLKHQ